MMVTRTGEDTCLGHVRKRETREGWMERKDNFYEWQYLFPWSQNRLGREKTFDDVLEWLRFQEWGVVFQGEVHGWRLRVFRPDSR